SRAASRWYIATTWCWAGSRVYRHCEERSDEAISIHTCMTTRMEIASSAFGLLAMTGSSRCHRPRQRIGHAILAPEQFTVGRHKARRAEHTALLRVVGRRAQPILDLRRAGICERFVGCGADRAQHVAQH